MDQEVSSASGEVYCKSCQGGDVAKCLLCSEGASMVGDKCVPCNEAVPHCDTCDGDKCKKCDYQVANLKNGKCDDCRTDNGWRWNTDLKRCYCEDRAFVNVLD